MDRYDACVERHYVVRDWKAQYKSLDAIVIHFSKSNIFCKVLLMLVVSGLSLPFRSKYNSANNCLLSSEINVCAAKAFTTRGKIDAD